MSNEIKRTVMVNGVIGVFLAVCVAGCASYEEPVDATETVSIPYDPYDFDPRDLQAEADAHCNAYGLNAVYTDETVDPSSVRWRYRHFECR